jgi:hypothetical protein
MVASALGASLPRLTLLMLTLMFVSTDFHERWMAKTFKQAAWH